MRLRTKLLLLLVLCYVSFNGHCIVNSIDPCINHCCIGAGQPFGLFTVIYADGSPNFVGRYDANGRGIYDKSSLTHSCDFTRIVQGTVGNNSLSASPSSIDLLSPPSSGTITGQGMWATNGMPRVDYFQSNGYFIGSVSATSAASDGTWIVAPQPDLSSVYSGFYQLKVTYPTEEGFYINEVGSASIDCWNRDNPDSDGDGWNDVDDCYPYDASRWYCNQGGGCEYQTYREEMPCYEY
ncbi:MAG: hypothetical protein JO360_16430 [Acidobacteria bacterium]|nr:hypothetical protein [Acidobacteriota bacterium]